MELYRSILFCIGTTSLALAAFLMWRTGKKLFDAIDMANTLTREARRALEGKSMANQTDLDSQDGNNESIVNPGQKTRHPKP